MLLWAKHCAVTSSVALNAVISILTTVCVKEGQNVRGQWIGGIDWWGSVTEARWARFSNRHSLSGHFWVIACAGYDLNPNALEVDYDLKLRDVEFFNFFETTATTAKKEKFSPLNRYRWPKVIFSHQLNQNTTMRTSSSCSYLEVSPKHLSCNRFAPNLVWSRRGYLLWVSMPNKTLILQRYRTEWMPLSRVLSEKRPQNERRHEKLVQQVNNARSYIAKPINTYFEKVNSVFHGNGHIELVITCKDEGWEPMFIHFNWQIFNEV